MIAIKTESSSDLERLTTEELRAELATALGVTARHLLHLATVWQELERRGEDLSDLRSGIGAYLPAIAAGTVLPEIVVMFAGQAMLLRAIAMLTPDAQRKLADGGTVPLVIPSPEGYTHRMLPAHALTAGQVRQVFGHRSVRNEAEQIAILTGAPTSPEKIGKPLQRGKVRADIATNSLRIGKYLIPVADVLAALADLNPGENLDTTEPDNTVVVKLTGAEKEKFTHAAVSGKRSHQDLIRRTLRAVGLI